MDFDEIKELTNVKAFHLSVKYDDKTKTLIFDRQMKEGSGEQIYGVTVAQYIVQDKEFIDLAIKFRNKLTNTYAGLTSGKKSRYNSNVLVDECKICGGKENLESHHINFQKDCENGLVKNKPHLAKNSEANLIVLCETCHDNIHNGTLILDKYVMSSNGKTILVKDKHNYDVNEHSDEKPIKKIKKK
jgi:5-methylcytosine-specific restriction endonuclease McrA